MIWNIKKKKKPSHAEQEEKRIQKNKDSISSHPSNFKRSKIRLIRLPGEEKEEEIRNLSEQIVKETDEGNRHASPGNTESPNYCLLYTSDAADEDSPV